MSEQIRVKVGDIGEAVMPYSEVCMHMKVAGRKMLFQIVSERAVQLFSSPMQPFSFPILLGEAGVFEDEKGMYYYPNISKDERDAGIVRDPVNGWAIRND